MNRDRPRVSVCIPTYRGAAFLPATLASLREQTLGDFEVIVVDDASPDDARAVVEACRDPRVRYVRNERNLGIPDNLERAIGLGRGEYVGIYEDHDLFDLDLLARSAALMDRDSTVGFVATGIRIIDFEDRTVAVYTRPWPQVVAGRWVARQLLTRPYAAFGVSNLIRRSALEQVPRPWFDPNYWWYADVHLWLRLTARFSVGYLREPLLSMRVRPAGHFLADKHWQSLQVIDRLHRKDWSLGYPDGGVESALAWGLFALRRDCNALWTLATERARGPGAHVDGGVWTLNEIGTLPGYLLAQLVRRLPLQSVRGPVKRMWAHLAKARRRSQQLQAFGRAAE